MRISLMQIRLLILRIKKYIQEDKNEMDWKTLEEYKGYYKVQVKGEKIKFYDYVNQTVQTYENIDEFLNEIKKKMPDILE